MEERVTTSFIPKASLAVERKPPKTGGQVALANVIAGVILVLAILGAAGMFAFERFTIQNIEAKRASLERSRAAFEPATIRELSRLNARIETGKALIADHVALSKLFDELEKRTLSTVRFGSFSYDAGAGRALLTANGQAASFNAVALQSGDFSESKVITDPIFSNVNIGQGSVIDFDFSAVIDTAQMGYSPTTAPAPVSPVPTGTTPPSTP